MVSEDKVNPAKSAPESPMKRDAGGKLKRRNPTRVPMRAARMKQMKISPSSAALIKKTAEETAATPAAKPSMLSRKLKAFEIPTIQRTLMRELATSLPAKSTRMPQATATTAASVCPANFQPVGNFSPSKSSIRPTRNMMVPPTRSPSRGDLTDQASRSASIASGRRALIAGTDANHGARAEPTKTVEVKLR